ncbi:MAG: DUF3291 domain-containing protein [Pseudomonadota bacterium]
MPIAEVNVARPRYDTEDPRFADFVDNLDRINGLAERSIGYIWRLKDEDDTAMSVRFAADPDLIINLSVWASVEDLERYVFGTLHHRFYERRAEWFPPLGERHFAMWPVADGHLPDVAEAEARLAQLNREGPSDDVFGWEAFPGLKLRREKACA